MEKIRFVGLDVHSRSIAIAVAESNGLPPDNLVTIPTETTALMNLQRKLGPLKNLRVCHETGPTRFGLCRDLKAAGVDCIVVAPSLVPVQHGGRVKTDRRDAVKLARFLRSGNLTEINVPQPETEAMRDLESARDDAKNAAQRASMRACTNSSFGRLSWRNIPTRSRPSRSRTLTGDSPEAHDDSASLRHQRHQARHARKLGVANARKRAGWVRAYLVELLKGAAV